VFVLGPGGPPRVVQLEALVAEVSLAVGTALGGLQGLGGLTEATQDGHTAQADRVSVPATKRLGEVSLHMVKKKDVRKKSSKEGNI